MSKKEVHLWVNRDTKQQYGGIYTMIWRFIRWVVTSKKNNAARKAIRQKNLQTLFEVAKKSHDEKFVRYVLHQIGMEWGDGKQYRRLYKHFNVLTGHVIRFDEPTPVNEKELEEYAQKIWDTYAVSDDEAVDE